jgi:hypothetical protein
MKKFVGLTLLLILITQFSLASSTADPVEYGTYNVTIALETATYMDVQTTVDCYNKQEVQHVNNSFVLWKELMEN